MSFAGGLSGALSVFDMYNTSKLIQKNNQAAVDAYNATQQVLNYAQTSNWINAISASEELKRVSNIGIMEAKPEIQQGASKVAMSEGVTAGNSKARMLQTYFLQAGQKVGQQQQATESAINKLAMGVEQENWNLQQQKATAYNNMQQKLITGNNAAFQIIGAGISGGLSGFKMGTAVDATDFGKKFDLGASASNFISNFTTSNNKTTGTINTNDTYNPEDYLPSGL